MKEEIFKKMKIKQGAKGEVLFLPQEFAEEFAKQTYVAKAGGQPCEFVVFFAQSLAEYKQRIPKAMELLPPDAPLWIGYKKSKGKVKYDINRDVLFELTHNDGLQLVANIALSEEWSLVRAKRIV